MYSQRGLIDVEDMTHIKYTRDTYLLGAHIITEGCDSPQLSGKKKGENIMTSQKSAPTLEFS